MKNCLKHQTAIFLILGGLLLLPPALQAQTEVEFKLKELEARITHIEDYLEQIQPSLDDFSKDLLDQLDLQMQVMTDKVVVLDPISKKFVKITSNTATFLIAVKEREKVDKGYRLHLQIGNPNAATFSIVRLKMKWGKKWDASFANVVYEDWRKSLRSGEFEFSGDLTSGKWTEFAVDLVPAKVGQLEYIECEMHVDKVKLEGQ